MPFGNLHWGLMVAFALNCLGVCQAADQDDEKADQASRIVLLERLRRLEFEEAEAIAFLANPELVKQRPRTTRLTISFLGAIRSRKALPALCDHLLDEEEGRRPPGMFGQYPVGAILVQIGEPAAYAILGRVSTSETSPEYRRVAIHVIHDIIGKDHLLKTIDNYAEYARKAQKDGQTEYKNYDPVKMIKIKELIRSRFFSDT